MNYASPSRPYRMVARAAATARTERAILNATVALWRERSLDEVTLEQIAERAGVSARTVIRRFGSREGAIAACIESDMAGIEMERERAREGDVAGALEVLLAHYEKDGDAVLRTLLLEEKIPIARAIAARGRAAHREWCARVFGTFLPPPGDAARDARLDAFVAATDLFLWKLLRRDLDRSQDETRNVLAALLEGLTGPNHPRP